MRGRGKQGRGGDSVIVFFVHFLIFKVEKPVEEPNFYPPEHVCTMENVTQMEEGCDQL